jgi:hypothetical protein
MLGRPILTDAQLNAHRVTVGNVNDVIWAPLFDFVSYITAGQLALSFFATPQGQGTTTAPGASGSKTIADTNMNSAGQLTKGNEFYMTGQEILFFPPGNPGIVDGGATANAFLNDTYLVSKSGVLTLKVGSDRNYIQDGPLGQFPAVTRLAVAGTIAGDVTGAVTTTNTNSAVYAAMAGETYTITPLYIESNQGFTETVNWPALVAISGVGRLGSRLRGYLIRAAQ